MASTTSAGTADAMNSADSENLRISWYLGYVWAATIAILLFYQFWLNSVRYIRTLACLGNDKQHYFAIPDVHYAKIKRYLLDAPLFRTRHNREFRLSTAINVGTLPSRLQSIYLVGYIVTNVTFCVVSIDYSDKADELATQLRNRTGVLAVMNMLPLFLLAGRNNPLIKLLDISYDTYNLVHRWIGRIVVLEILAHTLAWMVNKVQTSGWSAVGKAMGSSQLILSGTIGTCAVLAILLLSPSPIRHAYYEVFLHVHILLAVLIIIAVWVHLKTLRQQAILVGVVVIWAFERLMRFYSIVRNNIGRDSTQAEVEALPGDAVRVTLRVARPWKFRPGQHIYLYMPSVGLWTSHPFSLAWSDEGKDPIFEKGTPIDRLESLERRQTSMSLVIRRRTGFTEQLWRKAEASPKGTFVTSALVEGPYGNQSLDSYGHVLLFAAGIGITNAVPHVRDLVSKFAEDSGATRRVTLVWIIQSPEHLEWIRPWMTEILGMERRREVLKILLFVTRPRSMKEIRSPSASVQMFPGKPDVGALISQEQARQIGTLAVSVCGTGSLGDDVRRAVRDRSEITAVDFIEQSFSW